jgi:hypothetical protein
MSVMLYIYGSGYYCVRVGFTGRRPLIYAIYSLNGLDGVPVVPGQIYREITQDQYGWLCNHLNCDISYIHHERGWGCGLECRTHREFYHLIKDDSFVSDLWDDRQV